MRVRSKLADVEFRFGAIERRGDELVIHSHPDQPLKSRVHVSPADAVAAVGRLAASPAAWGFLLRLPWFLWRARRRNETEAPERRP